MADLFKRRTRKPQPLVEDGNVWTGTDVRWSKPDGSGMVQAHEHKFTLSVIGKGAADQEYTAHLSEMEMLSTVAAWLDAYNNMKRREQEKARGRQT